MSELQILFDRQRHIVCVPYTRENLHRAAKLLGIKRCWFHARPYPHYDMPKRWAVTKALEIQGLILDLEDGGVTIEEVTTREIVRICTNAAA